MNELYKPGYLKELCQESGLVPSKRYGQNFLISPSPIQKMISAADINKTDVVVEIGPGFGVLTLALAPISKKVISFEIERKLSGYWEERLEEYGNIEIVWGNVLNKFAEHSVMFGKSYKVIANLPYQITAPLLRTVLSVKNKPEQIVVMVQKEVAERICAKPGKMSLLAVSVQYYGTTKIIVKVPKGNFWPQPKVDSAVIKIEVEKRKKEEEKFFKVAKAGFKNKRKQLWRNLSEGLGLDRGLVKDVLKEVVGNEKIRAEQLGIEEWEGIARGLEI